MANDAIPNAVSALREALRQNDQERGRILKALGALAPDEGWVDEKPRPVRGQPPVKTRTKTRREASWQPKKENLDEVLRLVRLSEPVGTRRGNLAPAAHLSITSVDRCLQVLREQRLVRVARKEGNSSIYRATRTSDWPGPDGFIDDGVRPNGAPTA